MGKDFNLEETPADDAVVIENAFEATLPPEPKGITVQGIDEIPQLEWHDVTADGISINYNPLWVLLARGKGELTCTFKAFRPNVEGVLEDKTVTLKDFDGVISLPSSAEFLSATGRHVIHFNPSAGVQVAYFGGFNASSR